MFCIIHNLKTSASFFISEIFSKLIVRRAVTHSINICLALSKRKRFIEKIYYMCRTKKKVYDEWCDPEGLYVQHVTVGLNKISRTGNSLVSQIYYYNPLSASFNDFLKLQFRIGKFEEIFLLYALYKYRVSSVRFQYSIQL